MVTSTAMRYAVINLGTFSFDLACLSILRSGFHWPVPVAVTVAYATALSLSFVLNRSLNFHSHGRLARQVPVYLTAVAVNYVVWVLTLTSVLSAVGVDYRLARVVAGACEAVFMYVMMRFVVFTDVVASAAGAVDYDARRRSRDTRAGRSGITSAGAEPDGRILRRSRTLR